MDKVTETPTPAQQEAARAARRKRIADYLAPYDLADVLAVLEDFHTFEGRRGLLATLLGATRETYTAADRGEGFPLGNPIVRAAWDRVHGMEAAERAARLQEVGAR